MRRSWFRGPDGQGRLSARTLALVAITVAVVFELVVRSGGATAAGGDTYSAAVLADNPAAYWRLGEASGTALLDSKDGNSGTYSGGVLLGRPGAIASSADTAASFDGTDDYGRIPDSAAINVTSGVTLELWFKRGRSGYQVLAGKPGNGQSKFESYSIWLDSSNFIAAYFGNGSTYVRVGTPSPVDTNWHSVAATYDNATAKLYLDGVVVSSQASTVHLTPNTLPLNIGRANNGPYYFQGLLDEIALYPTALSAAAIKAHYDASTVDTVAPAVTLSAPVSGATLGTSPTAFSGVAGSAGGDASTVQVKVYPGSTASGTPLLTLTAGRQADASYAAANSSVLADGVYTAQAEQSDAAGNLGRSSAVTFTVDTVAPSPTLLAPVDGSSTSSPTPTATGVAGSSTGDVASVSVKVYAGSGVSGAAVRSLPAARQGDNTYSVVISPALAPGVYTVQVEQLDVAGNRGVSAPSTFTVLDSVAPVVTLTAPVAGSVSNVTSPVFAGTAGSASGDAGTVQISVYAGAAASGSPVQVLSAGRLGDNSYSAAAVAPLAEGVYTARAEQSDAAGNLGTSQPVTFTIDLTAPTPTLAAPANGSTTTDATPTFAGVGGTGAGDVATVTVKIWAGSSVTGSPLATMSTARSADGSYQVELATPLATGAYTARAEQADSAGNVGVSAANGFNVQSVPSGYRNDVISDGPRMLLRLGEASGTTALDAAGSNNGTYVNGVALNQPGAILNDPSTAASFDGVNDYVSVPDANAIDGVGAVTIEAWVKRSRSGAYQVILGKAGNGQSKFENYSLWLNTSNQLTAYFGNGTTFVAVGGPVIDTTWHHVAASYDNATARLYVDGLQRASATSSVQLTPNTLPLNIGRSSENTYFFGGLLDEVAVYPTALSASRIKSHFDSGSGSDTVAPAVELTSPAAGAAVSTGTPPLRGSGGRAPGDLDTVTVRTYSGSAAAGVALRTQSTSRSVVDGSWNVTVSPSLAEGTYTSQAEQSDTSGNVGRSAAVTFRVDTTAPVVTLTVPAAGAVTDTQPVFRGVAGAAVGDATSVTVDIYAGSSASGTPVQSRTVVPAADRSYSVNAAPALASGTFTAQTRQLDSAGNVGSSAARTFTVSDIDGTPPAVTLTAPANGSSTLSGTLAFSGAAGTAAGDIPSVSVSIYLGLTATGSPVETLSAGSSSGSWSATASPALALGTYTVIATQSDAAGNAGTSSPVTFTVGLNYRDEVLADSPAGYWRLGEASGATAVDETGANPGAYSGGITLQQVGALIPDANKAAAFNGTSGLVSVPDSSSLDATAAVTVELWVKRAKTGAYQVLVGKPGDGQSKNESYAIWINSDDHLAAYFGDRTSYASVFSSFALDTNWHHVAATYDNTTARLYVDGLLNASSPGNGVHLTANNLPLTIGQDNSASYIFGGLLDEVAVYPSALSAARIRMHYAKGDAFDGVAPTVTMTSPLAGTTISDRTPVFAGMAPITATDSPTVTVKVYAGSTATGSALQTFTTTRYSRGSWDAESPSALADGTYTAQAEEVDSAGNIGSTTATTFTIGPGPAAGADPLVLAAGDIAYCQDTGDDQTAALLDLFPTATVLTMGDNAYESGTAQEYSNCYDPTWGRAKTRTRPAPGDHDYATANAAAYFAYFAAELAAFGPTATDPNRGYYSYDLGTWHVVSLNSNCGDAAPGCNVDSQIAWLQSDLQAHPAQCTLVYASEPRFSSGPIHGDNTAMAPYWNVLLASGVDILLAGDDHDYERFAPQDGQGFAHATGPREFVVGTGGRSHYLFSDPNSIIKANSEIRNDDTFGVLKLNLRSGSYDWEFVPVAGKTFVDSGSDVCR